MTSAALITQQLAEFLAVISTCPDSQSAILSGIEAAARALEAEVAAVTSEYGVVSVVGFAAGKAPETELIEVAAGTRAVVRVPGAGECRAMVARIGGTEPRRLIVARSGDDGFTTDEVSLVRGMARVLELTVESMRTLESERRQAAENARLLVTLQERQRLMEQLSAIQRAIARRAPLQQILDTITLGARDLIGADAVGLRLRDADDPSQLTLVSSCGLTEKAAKRLWRVPVAQAGVAGQAVIHDDLVVVERYGTADNAIEELVALGMTTAMAAPVHENGVVVGSLVVAAFDEDRVFGKTEQEVLQAFAEHVSLAVTDAKTLEEMYQAFHDSLTGLASRALFIDRVEHGLHVADREGNQVAVLFIDLDRFKIVNDTMGHAAGDELLIGVAQRLQACLRDTDTVARFGGDEFAVLLHGVTRDEQAEVVADRIVRAVQEPFTVSGREVFIGSSVGVAFSTSGQHDPEPLLQDADLAMYEAKRRGKGRYETFEPGLRDSLHQHVNLETDLRQAVVDEEFVLRYQPIVALPSGRMTGVEALVRWQHPKRGLIPPMDFIPLAEETGAILAIGRWVLREACRQVSQWNAGRPGQPPLSVSVNLSAKQLHQPELVGTVAEALNGVGLDPACLTLEITESLLVRDTHATMEQLRRLKELGVRLAVDDFGTGYSSLAYLRHFPVDILKIDKTFIDQLSTDPRAAALTGAIVQLGHTLNLSTVAEGVEFAEQFAELSRDGCNQGQGYYFARPLDASGISALLDEADPVLPSFTPPPAVAG